MLNVTSWLLQQAKINVDMYEIAGSDFELITLTDEQIDTAKACESLSDLYEYAAVHGLAAESVRAVDLEGMTKDKIKALWLLPEFKDLDPSIIEQVGKVVCEMSKLDELIEELTPDPEGTVFDGDNPPDGETELGNLQDQLNADRQMVG